MADLPLTWFQLNATMLGLVADTGDPGLSPDFFTVDMDLTITPHIEGSSSDQLLLTTLTPPVTALMVPIPASIQNGVLVLPRQSAPSNQVNDPTQSAVPGLRLLAKSALLGIGAARLLYDVTPGSTTMYGNTYRFDSFTFAAPDIEPPLPYLLTIVGAPTGGTWAVTVVAGGSSRTATGLALTETASALQTALTGLPNVGAGNMTVAGSNGGPYTVTPTGALAGQPVVVSGDGSGLSGGTLAAVTSDAIVSTTLDLTTVARVTV